MDDADQLVRPIAVGLTPEAIENIVAALTRHLNTLAHRIDSSLSKHIDNQRGWQDDPLSEQQKKLNRMIEVTTYLQQHVTSLERDVINLYAELRAKKAPKKAAKPMRRKRKA